MRNALKLIPFALLAVLCTPAQEPKEITSNQTNVATYVDSRWENGPRLEIVYYTENPDTKHPKLEGLIRIHDKDGKEMLRVDDKGRATYSNGYTANEAATDFWKALADAYSRICEEALKKK